MTRIILACLIFIGCASGFRLQEHSPYEKYEFGLPSRIAKDSLDEQWIYNKGDMCWEKQPPQQREVWVYDLIGRAFLIEWDVQTGFDWRTPDFKAGDLTLHQIEVCKANREFCIEATIDGLTYNGNDKTRCQVLLWVHKGKKKYCLWTSLEIEGLTRACKITAFVPKRWLKKAEIIEVQVIDRVNGTQKKGVVEL